VEGVPEDGMLAGRETVAGAAAGVQDEDVGTGTGIVQLCSTSVELLQLE